MKTLVVASGKGGTGKTTLTAVFARIAARHRRLVVADCDVDASNLPIALRVEATGQSPFAGNPKPVVDKRSCRGCGICLDYCRFDAISLSDDGVAVIDPWLCENCGACAQACPSESILFVPHEAGEILTGETSVGPIVYGRLKPGEDLSGRLVTEVREEADRTARERGSGLILVDGPPGVGCPAIASITGADGVLAVTEPTLSGEHDLRRLVELANRLGVPVKVVLNKVDLSESGAERIREACRDLDLELMGEVAFDADLPSVLETVAQGSRLPSSLDSLASAQSFDAIWSRLEPWVDGWA